MRQSFIYVLKKCLTLALLVTLSIPLAQAVGPLMEGLEIITSTEGEQFLRTPDVGIKHRLDPDDWMQFRIKIIHTDGNETGYVSDGFEPTSGDIQLCAVEGCDALPIHLSPGDLNWLEADLNKVYLQAKTCQLCDWIDFEVDLVD